MPTDQLDKAIGKVCEAGVGDANLTDALSALGAPFSSGVYAVEWNTRAQRPEFEAVCHDLVQTQTVYQDYYGALVPRLSYTLRLPVGETMACHELFDADHVQGSEFHNDFPHRFGFRYAAGCRLLEEDGKSAVVGMQRPAQHEPSKMRERELIAAARPHLARAFRVRRTLGQAQDCAARRQAMLDRLTAAALLVDADGAVLEQNLAAERVLRANDGLVLRHRRLAARIPAETTRLLHLIKDAVAGAVRRGAGGGACCLSRTDASFYAVMIAPVGVKMQSGCGTPAALVLIADPHQRPLTSEQTLRTLYGLTAAEARTARALLAGHEPREIADQLGVGLATVRTHLHHVYDKTGTSRQADLVRLLTAHATLEG